MPDQSYHQMNQINHHYIYLTNTFYMILVKPLISQINSHKNYRTHRLILIRINLQQNFLLFCLFIQNHYNRTEPLMQHSISQTVYLKPQEIKIKNHSTQNIQEQLQMKSSCQKLIQNQIQLQSNMSNSKRLKVPESMRRFLRERNQVRQITKNSGQLVNQNKIVQKKKSNVMNQTSSQLNQQQINSIRNGESQSVQNISNVSLAYKKVLQRPVLTKNSIRSITCTICEGQIRQNNIFKGFKCRHIFCQQCTQSYIKYKINMFEQVFCPQQSCKQLLDIQTQFYKKLGKRQRRMYKKIHLFYISHSDPLKKLCPKQQCQGIIDIKQGSDKQQCPKCRLLYCSLCYMAQHQGECRSHETKFMEDTLRYRQCQKCRIVVERLMGCNHIICKCGNHFCYECGGKWRHDHLCRPANQFQDTGCDWGQSWQDHFLFLIKLPLKFIILTVYTLFWFSISFAAAPYNLFFFLYWSLLIFFGGPFVYIFQEGRQLSKIILLFLVFPLLIIYCIPLGVQLFIQRFEDQCPYIADGYRYIITL